MVNLAPPLWEPCGASAPQLGLQMPPGAPNLEPGVPQDLQDGAKMAPRPSKMPCGSGLKSPGGPEVIQGPPLAWSQNGLRSPHLCGKSALRPPGPPKWIQDWTQDFSSCSQMRPRPCLGTHMLPPRHHNLSSECLQVLPTWSHGGPRTSKVEARWPQDEPKCHVAVSVFAQMAQHRSPQVN